jgi:hypothetical protein
MELDFETPACKLYLFLISAKSAKEKGKNRKSTAACWCFEVGSSFSI